MKRNVLRRSDGVVEIRAARPRPGARDPGRWMRGCSVLVLLGACAACKVLGPGLFLALAAFLATAAVTGAQLLAALRAGQDAVILRHPRAR